MIYIIYCAILINVVTRNTIQNMAFVTRKLRFKWKYACFRSLSWSRFCIVRTRSKFAFIFDEGMHRWINIFKWSQLIYYEKFIIIIIIICFTFCSSHLNHYIGYLVLWDQNKQPHDRHLWKKQFRETMQSSPMEDVHACALIKSINAKQRRRITCRHCTQADVIIYLALLEHLNHLTSLMVNIFDENRNRYKSNTIATKISLFSLSLWQIV